MGFYAAVCSLRWDCVPSSLNAQNFYLYGAVREVLSSICMWRMHAERAEKREEPGHVSHIFLLTLSQNSSSLPVPSPSQCF